MANHRRPVSDQPDRKYVNPLKADRTCDDMGKKLGQCDRHRISANFSLPGVESADMASGPKL